MAKFLGLAIATWQKIERNEGLPSGETLLLFEQLGINAGWILTGLGPKHLKDRSPAPSIAVDPQLLRKLHRAARLAYKEEGFHIPDEDSIAIEAGNLYNQLLESVSDVRDTRIVDAIIPVLIEELKARLGQAKAEPGTGKRSA